MNLSLNKINEVKTKEVSFKGMKSETDYGNAPLYEFTAPPHRHDELVTLELALLQHDNETGGYIAPKEEDFLEGDFFEAEEADGKTVYREKGSIPIYHEALSEVPAFAFRYKIQSKDGNVRYYTDPSQTIDFVDKNGETAKLNLIKQEAKPGISPKGGTMYHVLPDSNLVKQLHPNQPRVTARSHFNKIGGTSEDILYLVDNTNVFKPYRYVMATPDIGRDRISSHKYWPENQYQCTNEEIFKELNRELYKQGKGYVADGAFTSQGLNSPMVQRAFKWGDKSGCQKMLKIDGRFCPALIPNKSQNDKEDVYANIGVRLVNGPQSKDYDKHKRTYIQFYDQRLLSEEKQKNTKDLIYDYDKETDDHYDFVKHDDSVLPIPFEIDPKDPKIKQVFSENSNVLLKDIENVEDFLTFENGTIATKHGTSGSTNWDGNADIVKMDTDNEYTRQYLQGIATYWTEMIQKDLILTTVKMSDKERQAVAKKNDIPLEGYEQIKKTINTEDFDSPILTQNKTAETFLAEFPIHSLKTDPELSGLFMEPDFDMTFFNTKIGADTVFEKITGIVNDTIEASIPQKYKGNEEYKTYVTKIYTQDIIKNIIVGAMGDDLINKDGSINEDKLKDINIMSFENHKSISPDDEIDQVSKGLAKGIDAKNVQSLQEKMAKELKSVSLDDFKISETVVLKGKAGLNWRYDAAKDIGDLDAIRSGQATFEQIWYGDEEHPGVINFWKKFIENVRESNPASLIINEITNLAEFYQWHDIESIRAYGGEKAVKAFEKLTDAQKEFYKFNPAYRAEKDFVDLTGAITTSMFDEGFNRFSSFTGVNPETGECVGSVAGNLHELKQQMKELQIYSQPNNSIFAHSFIQNHDKPALLHCLPLDMSVFHMDTMDDKRNPFYDFITKDVTGRDDYRNISPKAVAVGYMLKKGLKEQVKNSEDQEAMFNAIKNLASGKRKDDAENDFNRAEAFGTLPFEIALKDIAQDAGVKNFDAIDAHLKNIDKPLEYQLSMLKLSNAMPGIFTFFNGAEFGQTGYETPNKNVHVDNRNRILREYRNDPRFAPYIDEIEAHMGLYQKPGMSALGGGYTKLLNVTELKYPDRNKEMTIHNAQNFEKFKNNIAKFIEGTTNYPKGKKTQISSKLIFEVLDQTKGTPDFDKLVTESFGISKEQIPEFIAEYDALKQYYTEPDEVKLQLSPAFSYDEKGSRTVIVATNNGVPTGKTVIEHKDYKEGVQEYQEGVDIVVEQEKQNFNVEKISLIDEETGVSPLEDGTILKRKVYDKKKKDFVDENCEYVVKDGAIVKKSAVGKAKLSPSDYISIDDATATFYAPKDGQKYKYLASSYYNGAK